jgi:hypothetical protein
VLENAEASFRGRDSSEDKHADVQGNTFAFGVILLEIISGRLPYCKDKGYLVDWVSPQDQGLWLICKQNQLQDGCLLDFWD